jgi:dTDP-4-dehydrorhamnose 3,5-epimerase
MLDMNMIFPSIGAIEEIMEIKELMIPGCFRILPNMTVDRRGAFIKTFVKEEYQASGLFCDFVEEYYSRSYHGVIRGLHFQIPPHEHYKLVVCLFGNIIDVIVDLRIGSPTFRKFDSLEMDADHNDLLYLPPGIAHGFISLSEITVVAYKVSSLYSPNHDTGIRWDSIPFDWGIENPILSDRDKSFLGLEELESPFTYQN